jgi:hypothetical protein
VATVIVILMASLALFMVTLACLGLVKAVRSLSEL